MRIALIGAPGSGKGTQARLLAERYRIAHISTGDLLREAAKTDNNFDQEARKVMNQGQLVADDVVRNLLDERLRQRDTKRGFVIDGYPRNIPQAQSLDNLLGMIGRSLQIAVHTDVDSDMLVKRITGRLTCSECSQIYNKFFSPPAKQRKCDKCGGKLDSRKDDSEKVIVARVKVFKEATIPLITYYRAQHKLRTVSASALPDEIHENICAIVDLEIRPLEIESMVTAADSMDEEQSTVIAGGQINKVQPNPEAVARKKALAQKKKQAAVKPAVSKTTTAKKKSAKTSKITSKKAAAKKSAAKKPVAKEVTTKKATAKRPAAKKTTAKKSAAKKSASKKTVAKKSVKKKPATKKTTASKPVTKKTVSKKPATKKATIKKTTAKQVPAKKLATKKTAARKSAAKKPTTNKDSG